MTTPNPEGAPPPARSAPSSGIAVRPLAAWALLALAGAIIIFGVLRWMFPASQFLSFAGRLGFETFVSIPVLVAPLLAVLLAARVNPVLPRARLITLIALIEYAAALLFGGLAFLLSIASRFDGFEEGIYAFGGVLQALASLIIGLLNLALLALAGLYVLQVYTGLGGRLAINVNTT